jgi:hypothetical protein
MLITRSARRQRAHLERDDFPALLPENGGKNAAQPLLDQLARWLHAAI